MHQSEEFPSSCDENESIYFSNSKVGVKDEFGALVSCHKRIANTLQPLKNMHITLPNEDCSSNELDEHPTELTTMETGEPYKRGCQP